MASFRSLMVLFILVANYADNFEEAARTMMVKINDIIDRHNQAVDDAEEQGLSYSVCLDTHRPYMSSLELDIIYGLNPRMHYEKITKRDLVPPWK